MHDTPQMSEKNRVSYATLMQSKSDRRATNESAATSEASKTTSLRYRRSVADTADATKASALVNPQRIDVLWHPIAVERAREPEEFLLDSGASGFRHVRAL